MNNKKEFTLPNFYAILPSYIRYDKKLSSFDKVMYSEITALTNAKGFCYAFNSYFELVFNVSTSTIQRSLSRLEEQKYIFIDIERDKKTNQFISRKLYLIFENIPRVKNEGTPPIKIEGFTRNNALSLNNNTSMNTNVNHKSFNYSKSKPKDIEVDWLEDYIKENYK